MCDKLGNVFEQAGSMNCHSHSLVRGIFVFTHDMRSKDLKGRDHSEDLGVDGRIILECILGK
jgi:hypothetical protein